MQLNITTDYAIRILIYLAKNEKLTTAKEISEAMFIPEGYIGKITRKLKESGIINTYNGAKGGFELIKNPNDITLLDVINAMEKSIKINRCLEEDNHCNRNRSNECHIRKYYEVIQNQLENNLKNITIKNCIDD